MENLKILGLDIGGANTKVALLTYQDDNIVDSYSYIVYFPFWEKSIKDIPVMLEGIILNLIERTEINSKDDVAFISITITAELSDAFQTKREGILKILSSLDDVFDNKKLFFINTESEFVDFKSARSIPLSISAANWVSTSLFLGEFVPQCILIDAGSTTIDVIPIQFSNPIPIGKDDISRLVNHELIYTGGLRATIPSITHFIPYKEQMIRVSFEKFALISDVHRILENISEDEYTNDTADNRSKSLEDCYSRLARIICMDIELISKEELNKMAKFIYEKQLEIISKEIQEFYKSLTIRIPEFKLDPLFIITGSSSDFLIRKSLERLGFANIESYERVTNIPDNVSSSAFAVAGALYFQLKKN